MDMNTTATSGIGKNTAKEIWLKLFLTADMLRNTAFKPIETELRVNYAQFPISLFFLVYPNARPAMKDLLEMTGLSSGAASQAVDAMVEDGLLERVRSETDLRSYSVHVTEKIPALRGRLIRYYETIQDAFLRSGGITPEEFAATKEVFVRLAESRTGGEHAAAKQPSDLAVPGLVSSAFISRESLDDLSVWLLLLLFTANLRSSTSIYFYGKHVRMTLGKIRVMSYLFYLSFRKKEHPSLKDLAERFRTTSSLMAQTLNALMNDGMLERVVEPSDSARTYRVRLTRQGLLMRRRTAASYTDFMLNFFAETDQEKIELFGRVLDRMMQFLQTDGKQYLLSDEQPDEFC